MGTPTPLEPAPAGITERSAVYLKREDVHELGAFKWRGALPALERFRDDGATGVVTASTGNHGAATAWAASQIGLTATIFVPEGASQTKLAHITRLGAELVECGADLDEAKEQAVRYAGGMGHPFFEDGAEPAQLDGYEAIGNEIVDQLDEPPGAVVVPVGNGALLAGVGRSLGERSPTTRRIGVVSAGAPVMALSWRAGEPVDCELCDSIADGLAVRVAIPIAVKWLLEDADEMVEVSETEIARAVATLDAAEVRAEAAAAAALAAVPHVDTDEGPIVLVVTGRNIDDELLEHCRSVAQAERPQDDG